MRSESPDKYIFFPICLFDYEHLRRKICTNNFINYFIKRNPKDGYENFFYGIQAGNCNFVTISVIRKIKFINKYRKNRN